MSTEEHAALTPQEIEQVERELLERFSHEVAPAADGLAMAMIVGAYPGTVIRVVANAQGESRTHEWSIWDGEMTGAAPRPGAGVGQFLHALEVRIIEWLAAAYWRSPE